MKNPEAIPKGISIIKSPVIIRPPRADDRVIQKKEYGFPGQARDYIMEPYD